MDNLTQIISDIKEEAETNPIQKNIDVAKYAERNSQQNNPQFIRDLTNYLEIVRFEFFRLHFNVLENFLKLILVDSSNFLIETIFPFLDARSSKFLRPKYRKIIFFWIKLPKMIFKHSKSKVHKNNIKYIQFCNNISDFVYTNIFSLNNKICQVVLAELLCVGIHENIINDNYLEKIDESFLKLFKDNIQLTQNQKTIENAIDTILKFKQQNKRLSNGKFKSQVDELKESLKKFADEKIKFKTIKLIFSEDRLYEEQSDSEPHSINNNSPSHFSTSHFF